MGDDVARLCVYDGAENKCLDEGVLSDQALGKIKDLDALFVKKNLTSVALNGKVSTPPKKA